MQRTCLFLSFTALVLFVCPVIITAAAAEPSVPTSIRDTVFTWAKEDAALDRAAGRTSEAQQTETEAQALAAQRELQVTSQLSLHLFPNIADLEHNPYAKDLFAKVVDHIDFNEKFPKGEIKIRSEARGWNYIVLSSEAHDLLLAFAHPQSRYKGNPRLLLRALRILDNGFDGWLTSDKTLADFGTFDLYSLDYLLLKTALPGAILPSKKARWEKAIAANATKVAAQKTAGWNQPGPHRTYLNSDVRYMNGLAYAGAALGRKEFTDLAAKGLIWNAGALLPDGAFNYLGNQTECFTYHEVDLLSFAAYYLFTSDPVALDLIKKSRHYYPLSQDPRGVPEYYTAPSWKFAWNMSKADKGAALVASLTGDLQNARLAENVASDFVLACFYKTHAEPAPAPDNYLLYDGNIEGPRGRFGDYSFAGVLRDASNLPVGPWGTGLGRGTFVGAMQLNRVSEPGKFPQWPMNAVINGVGLGLRVKPTDGSGSLGEQRASQRYMMQDIRGEAIVRPRASSLVAAYHLTDKTSTGPEAFKALPWQGRQMWLLLPDRMVGWVELQPEGEQSALGVLGRIELLSGRAGWGEKKDLISEGDGRYHYGRLSLRVVEQNLGQPVPTKTAGIYAGANTGGDDKFLILYLAPPDTAPKKYLPGQPLHFVVEVRSAASEQDAKVEQVKLPNGLWRLAVREPKRDLWLYYNPEAKALKANENLSTVWHKASVQEAAADGTQLAMSGEKINVGFTIPPGGSRMVIASELPEDHLSKSSTYEEIFDVAQLGSH